MTNSDLLYKVELTIQGNPVRAERFFDIITVGNAKQVELEIELINEKIIDLLSLAHTFELNETRQKETCKNVSFLRQNKDLALLINRIDVSDQSLQTFIERIHFILSDIRTLPHDERRSSVIGYKNSFAEHIATVVKDGTTCGVSLMYGAYKGRYNEPVRAKVEDKIFSTLRTDILRMQDMFKFVEKGKIWDVTHNYATFNNIFTFEFMAHPSIPLEGYLMDISKEASLTIECEYVPVIQERTTFTACDGTIQY